MRDRSFLHFSNKLVLQKLSYTNDHQQKPIRAPGVSLFQDFQISSHKCSEKHPSALV